MPSGTSASKVTPVVVRVMYLDQDEVREVLADRSLGTIEDCWHEVEGFENWPDEVCAKIRQMCDTTTSNRIPPVYHGEHWFARVWPLFEPNLPLAIADKRLASVDRHLEID